MRPLLDAGVEMAGLEMTGVELAGMQISEVQMFEMQMSELQMSDVQTAGVHDGNADLAGTPGVARPASAAPAAAVPAPAAARPGLPDIHPSAFRSFWMAGYEGSDHVNVHGMPLDMVSITGHAQQLHADYARAAALGLRTARESAGWRVCCPQSASSPDFTRLREAAHAALDNGVQLLWTLMHYGTPPDVQVMDADFPDRLADFAAAAVRELQRINPQPGIYNPINEIGFLAWAMATRAVATGTAEELDGYVVKCQLVRACLRAIEAIRAEDPGARFLHVEPLIHVVAPAHAPELHEAAQEFVGYQWQVWDMLLGRMAPELGGTPAAVDWIGANHYHDAQFELGSGQRLDWHSGDPRRVPFSSLLTQAWQRYGLPMIVAETSHVGEGRARWLDEIAAETAQAMRAGADIQGICLYPAVDRPDWNNLHHWHNSGLWDAIDDDGQAPAPLSRRLALDYAQALAAWQGPRGAGR